jgi:hypothetical protein
VPEQDPIPPRRHARHNRPGEDDDVPPWANLPPVRPGRPGAPSRPAGPAPRRDGPRHSDGPRYPDGPRQQDGPRYPDAAPRQDGPRYPDGPGPGYPQRAVGSAGAMRPGSYTPPGGTRTPTGDSHTPPGGYSAPSGHTPPGGYPAPAVPSGGLGPAIGQRGLARPADPMGWAPEPADDDVNYPGWAAAQQPDPPDDGWRGGRAGQRAARLLLRRRHRTYLYGGAVIVVVAAVLLSLFLTRSSGQSVSISGDLITKFQPGELQQVPDSCQVVTQNIVSQYLPGKVKIGTSQEPYGNLGSQCFWTVDSPPVYRLLDLTLRAYPPYGLAVGDGSATDYAIDQYSSELQTLQRQEKQAATATSPKTTVTVLSSLGNEAFSALQVYKNGGATTDVATVEIRFHNVIVTAAMSGMAGHTVKGEYGPLTPSQLEAAAKAFAESALASLH